MRRGSHGRMPKASQQRHIAQTGPRRKQLRYTQQTFIDGTPSNPTNSKATLTRSVGSRSRRYKPEPQDKSTKDNQQTKILYCDPVRVPRREIEIEIDETINSSQRSGSSSSMLTLDALFPLPADSPRGLATAPPPPVPAPGTAQPTTRDSTVAPGAGAADAAGAPLTG